MRIALLGAALLSCAALTTPAAAATLVVEGITYELDLLSLSNGGFTGNFSLNISGINGATDPIKGRTSINAFAFNDPTIGTAISGTSNGFTFQTGGLNSSGCNGNGNFFCFDNTSAVFPSPLPSAGSLLFSVTSNTLGSWSTWAPDFKIDWTGSANNYDLVSQTLPVTVCTGGGCPTPTPFDSPVPEPSTWLTLLMGFGLLGAALRRKGVAGIGRLRVA